MDRFLKRIHRVRPAAFCSRDFFLLHDNAPAHKATSLYQFLSKKYVTTLYPPPILSRSISVRLLYFLLRMKLKGLHFADVTEFQEAITDVLKKVQKEEFSAAFQKLYDRANPIYMPTEFILN
jgi:hypothetical protein